MTYTEARRPLTEEEKDYYKREIKEQVDEVIMRKYKLKSSKASSKFSKEIEAFRYNGNFNETNVPDWFVEAIINETVVCWDKVDSKDKLFIRPYGVVAEDGHYIVRKLSGNIAACTEEMLHEYYDIAE